jgi:hypothetical protein
LLQKQSTAPEPMVCFMATLLSFYPDKSHWHCGSLQLYSFVCYFQVHQLHLPLRVSSEDEVLGLDSTQHNEKYMQGTLLVPNNGQLEEHMVD